MHGALATLASLSQQGAPCTLRLEVPRHWSLRELSEAVQHLRAKKAGYVKHVSFL